MLMWVTVVRIAQVIGPPTGSNLAETTGARPVYVGAAIGMALMALLWAPLRSRLDPGPVSEMAG